MRNPESKVQRFIEGIILFGISPLLGVFLIYSAIWMFVRILPMGRFDLLPLMLAGGLLLVGAGLLQFSYLVFFKKGSRLNTGVICLASICFMLLGLIVSVSLFFMPIDEIAAHHYARAPSIFFVGLAGFIYARKRKGRTSQSSQPLRRSAPPGRLT